MKQFYTTACTQMFSAADIDKRIKIRSKSRNIAALLRAVINDYKKYEGPYKGTKELSKSFVKDVYAILADAPAFSDIDLVQTLNLRPYGERVVDAAKKVQLLSKKAATVKMEDYATACNNLVFELWIAIS